MICNLLFKKSYFGYSILRIIKEQSPEQLICFVQKHPKTFHTYFNTLVKNADLEMIDKIASFAPIFHPKQIYYLLEQIDINKCWHAYYLPSFKKAYSNSKNAGEFPLLLKLMKSMHNFAPKPLLDLPLEIVDEISTYLSWSDLGNLRQTCKAFKSRLTLMNKKFEIYNNNPLDKVEQYIAILDLYENDPLFIKWLCRH